MPQIGEIQTAKSLGYKGYNKRVWAACISCGKERWVVSFRTVPIFSLCAKCSFAQVASHSVKDRRGNTNPNWRGGRYKDRSNGYSMFWVGENDFFFSMTRATGYVLEHRLVMAKHLGRNLQSWEEVHHKNGIKDDNRLENLELTTVGSHSREHGKGYRDGYAKGLIDGRDKQLAELKLQNDDLMKQIKLLQLMAGQTRSIF